MESFSEKSTHSAVELKLTRKEIFLLIKSQLSGNSYQDHYAIIQKELHKKCDRYNLSENNKKELERLISKIKSKWQKAHRIEKKFLETNADWLSAILSFTEPAISQSSTLADNAGSGRPSSSFQESSDRTKRRKTEDIRQRHDVKELGYATQMKLRAEGKLDAAKVVQDVIHGTPTRASRYRKSLDQVCEKTLSSDAALAVLIDNKLTKDQYLGIRKVSLKNDCTLYPPYHHVLEAKQKCYPDRSEITFTECCAEVKLQALLDITADRILLAQLDVLKNLPNDKSPQFELICKWGCDGTSGQSTFKQTFENDDGSKTDENIFFTSLVPLQLKSVMGETNDFVIWKNPRPSSPRFCRPIKIEFVRETVETTKKVVDEITEQQKHLKPFKKIVDDKEINVNFVLALTMIDGKVCNSLTDTSSAQRCYLCNFTSSKFNEIDEVLTEKINEDHLQFGISSLHAWIRFFECLLHLSYRLEIQKKQIRKKDKEQCQKRKEKIQKDFRVQLGLLVDQPKQGYGSTNDGNTARRFFQNSSVSAAITEVDIEIIERFSTILRAISCGYDINVKKFEEFALATARKFVELYPWFHMPTTVHKILMHGSKIIENSLLPIGQMSEEAQESCNKYIKNFRQNFSRKCSRIKTMEDVFLRLLITSDPVISTFREIPSKDMKWLSADVLELLELSDEQKECLDVDKSNDVSDIDDQDEDN